MSIYLNARFCIVIIALDKCPCDPPTHIKSSMYYNETECVFDASTNFCYYTYARRTTRLSDFVETRSVGQVYKLSIERNEISKDEHKTVIMSFPYIIENNKPCDTLYSKATKRNVSHAVCIFFGWLWLDRDPHFCPPKNNESRSRSLDSFIDFKFSYST